MQIDQNGLVIEVVKLLLSSTIGGLLGGWISFRFFRSQVKFQTKLQDNLHRRDALRDIHTLLHVIYRDTYRDLDPNKASEHMDPLHKQINEVIAQFTSDQEITKALGNLKSMIGSGLKDYPSPGIGMPGQAKNKIQALIEKRIAEIEKDLY